MASATIERATECLATRVDPSAPDDSKSWAELGAPRWYVIQCKARQEARALEHLERQRYECFLPRRCVERNVQGHRCDAYQPLFPGYLFIRLNSVNDDWIPIRSTRGVFSIVRFREYPEPIADELITQIRERLAVRTVSRPYLTSGDRVIITETAFSQIEAIFVSNDGRERVRLLMQILSDQHEVSVPLSIVRKI